MLKLGAELEKIVNCNKNATFPVLIMGAVLVSFFSMTDFSPEKYQLIHSLMMGCCIFTLMLMCYFRLLSSVMFVSVIGAGYLIINNLKYVYGEDYVFSSGYNIWTGLLFPDLTLAYFLFCKEKAHRYWSWFYVFLFLQTSLVEKLQNQSMSADSYYFYSHVGTFNHPSLIISVYCIITLLFYQIKRGRILGAAVLFSEISVFLGVYLSDNAFALGLFFLTAVLIMLVTSLFYIIYSKNTDEDLGMKNSFAYKKDAERKYPLKYSIALMYIDEYERLVNRFGAGKMPLLKKMFYTRIKEVNEEVLIYNYKTDAFILAFMNMNAAESFEQAEEIRRVLAKSIFVFNENTRLQLTVSQCISEKKRSDADAEAVLMRAEENLRKACRFTRNITIKA